MIYHFGAEHRKLLQLAIDFPRNNSVDDSAVGTPNVSFKRKKKVLTIRLVGQ